MSGAFYFTWGAMTQQQIRELQLVAIEDYKKRLITRTQLVNIVHQLDRKSFIHSA